MAFLERLAVLVPRPRVNLILYYGVLAPRAAWRSKIVPGPERGETGAESVGLPEAPERSTPRGYRWAELLRRTFGVDVLACPRCGGRLMLIALIERSDVIARLLGHLRLPSELPRPAPARSRGQAAGLDPRWADGAAIGGGRPIRSLLLPPCLMLPIVMRRSVLRFIVVALWEGGWR